jgi:hypothetical protein
MYLGKHVYVGELYFDKLFYIYPNVDIVHELGMMDDWLDSNPRRRKKNYRRFITNWLKAEQRKADRVRPEVMVGAGPVLTDEQRTRLQEKLAKRQVNV